MKKTVSLLLIVICFLLVFCLRGYYKILEADPEEGYSFNKYQSAFDKQFSLVKIPEQLDFAGEKVPIHELKVRQKFSNEYVSNSYWLISSLFADPEKARMYSRSLAIIKEKKIPIDFIYLMIAESGLKNSVSTKGAAGIWQLMPESAKGLGLRVDDDVDERYDYVKSTYAACEYFKQAYDELGDWTLTAASYNMGIGGISRRVGDDTTKTFFDLYLNRETSSYLYKVLAIKVAMKNPGRFDYGIKKGEANGIYSFKVDTSIKNLQQFAEGLGYDIFMLKKYNPWLISNQLLNPDGKTYTIEFPPTMTKVPEVMVTPLSTDTENLSTIQRFMLHEE